MRATLGHSPGELSGCHNDVGNMKEYIKDCHGFEDDNITILMDDGSSTEPTRANILAAYKKLVAETQPGDAVFCHYSGHGGKLRDDDGDEGEYNKKKYCVGRHDVPRAHANPVILSTFPQRTVMMRLWSHWTINNPVRFVTMISSKPWWAASRRASP